MSLWIGFDFDGVLVGPPSAGRTHGDDIQPMVDLLRLFLSNNIPCRIFTARAGNPHSTQIVQNWLDSHGLAGTPITDKKDFNMAALFDDLAITSRRGQLLTPLDTVNTILSTLNFSISPIEP